MADSKPSVHDYLDKLAVLIDKMSPEDLAKMVQDCGLMEKQPSVYSFLEAFILEEKEEPDSGES